MRGRRYLASIVVALAAAGFGRAQGTKYNLAEALPTDACFQIELSMTLQGDMKVQQEGKVVALKQSAQANHNYFVRVMLLCSV
jgi:hypothetical protein